MHRGASPSVCITDGRLLDSPSGRLWDPALEPAPVLSAGQLASHGPSPGHWCHCPLAWCCCSALH
eukprot:12153320-Alexandrium_andersonii.AAC.1